MKRTFGGRSALSACSTTGLSVEHFSSCDNPKKKQRTDSSRFHQPSDTETLVSSATFEMKKESARETFEREFESSPAHFHMQDLHRREQQLEQKENFFFIMSMSDKAFEDLWYLTVLEKQQIQSRLLHLKEHKAMLLAKRYISRTYTPVESKWLNEVLPSCNESNFRFHTRMDRRSFGVVLNVLESQCAHVFENKSFNKQIPVAKQLHMALFTLGFYGNAASFMAGAHKYSFSVGMITNARDRVCSALFGIMHKYITWPDAEERARLCADVEKKHGYKWCFFAVDGTTHPLLIAPKMEKESFYDRKKQYSINALVTNDFCCKVVSLVVGYPGSAHDERVMKKARYNQEHNNAAYFTNKEHGLGDAAFKATIRVVPTYKKPLADLPENTTYNFHHSSLRISAEHTIGMVKNRFQGLKQVRLFIKDAASYHKTVQYICAAYVLHNMILEERDLWHGHEDDEDDNDTGVGEKCGGDDTVLQDDYDGNELREEVKQQVLSFVGYT